MHITTCNMSTALSGLTSTLVLMTPRLWRASSATSALAASADLELCTPTAINTSAPCKVAKQDVTCSAGKCACTPLCQHLSHKQMHAPPYSHLTRPPEAQTHTRIRAYSAHALTPTHTSTLYTYPLHAHSCSYALVYAHMNTHMHTHTQHHQLQACTQTWINRLCYSPSAAGIEHSTRCQHVEQAPGWTGPACLPAGGTMCPAAPVHSLPAIY